MSNLYTMALSRDEVRGLLEHYKLVGKEWSDLFAKDQSRMNESGLVYPKYPAPVVIVKDGVEILEKMRWGMPGPVFPPKPGAKPTRQTFITNRVAATEYEIRWLAGIAAATQPSGTSLEGSRWACMPVDDTRLEELERTLEATERKYIALGLADAFKAANSAVGSTVTSELEPNRCCKVGLGSCGKGAQPLPSETSIAVRQRRNETGPVSASEVPAQPVDATQALNLSAGVSNCKVSRGRSLSRRATLFR